MTEVHTTGPMEEVEQMGLVGETEEGTALDVHHERTRAVARAFSFDDMMQYAEKVAASGLLPPDINTAPKALAIMLAGRELGIPPMTACRMVHIVEGRISLAAELALGIFRRAGGKVKWLKDGSDNEAEIHLIHPHGDEAHTTFTMAQAKTAGLLHKHNWLHYPANMLRARVSYNALRMCASDIVLGLRDPDELGAEYEILDDGAYEIIDNKPVRTAPPVEHATEKQLELIAKLMKSHVWSDAERERYHEVIGMHPTKEWAHDCIEKIQVTMKKRKAKEKRARDAEHADGGAGGEAGTGPGDKDAATCEACGQKDGTHDVVCPYYIEPADDTEQPTVPESGEPQGDLLDGGTYTQTDAEHFAAEASRIVLDGDVPKPTRQLMSGLMESLFVGGKGAQIKDIPDYKRIITNCKQSVSLKGKKE